MNSRKNAFRFGLAAASLGAIAVAGVNCGVAADSAGDPSDDRATAPATAEGPAGHVQQDLPAAQCVTIQRGSFGNVADTMIASNIDGAHNPDNTAGDGNFGADTVFIAGKVGLGQRIGLVRWDLSTLPPNLGITSATASLQARSDSQGGYGNLLSVYAVTSAWTEGGVTWNSAPSFNATSVASDTGGPGTHTFDLTALAQGWATGTNDGIELQQNGFYYTAFNASENATLALRPALDVCYIPDLCHGVTCSASDACHAAGTCDPNTGTCSNPAAADGTACPIANGAGSCETGSCTVASCSAGFGDCDANPADGCETSLTSNNSDCGTCGNVCTGGTSCVSSSCVASNASVQILLNCQNSPPVLETDTGVGCHNFSASTISGGASWANVSAGATVTLYQNANCTGGSRTVSGSFEFCGNNFSNGAAMNDNARSVYINP